MKRLAFSIFLVITFVAPSQADGLNDFLKDYGLDEEVEHHQKQIEGAQKYRDNVVELARFGSIGLYSASLICKEAMDFGPSLYIKRLRFFIDDVSRGRVDIDQVVREDPKTQPLLEAVASGEWTVTHDECEEMLTATLLGYNEMRRNYEELRDFYLSAEADIRETSGVENMPVAPILTSSFF